MTKRWFRPTSLPIYAVGLFTVIYFVARFFRLTALPIFADEAIYIRWAQLILHEPQRYAFFSVNDGKPPLFIWMITPFVALASDPVWAARAVSALVGFGQLFVNDWLVRQLRGGWRSRMAVATITILVPFWFFHHRMALLDATLTLWLSVCLAGLISLHTPTNRLRGLLAAGLGWGLALWTKTPALFFAPVFLFVAVAGPWFLDKTPPRSWRDVPWLARLLWFGASGVVGLAIFSLLRLSPAFGSLFARSSDFTFTTQQLLGGDWRTSLDNAVRLLQWLSAYLRPEVISLTAIAALISKRRRLHWFLLAAAAAFAAPLLLYGRTLHPRYFLPLAPLLTLSAGIFAAEAWTLVQKAKNSFFQVVFMVLVGFFFVGSLRFILLGFFTPNQLPFVLHDREQYLTEWSSGHGIREIRDMLLDRARRGERTTVVTEGSFGTLPDGLLLYFDRAPEIQHLRIEGLAQYPVKFLPLWVLEEAGKNETWLVVNEHRMQVPLDQVELVARFERPYGAPELQVYRVKAVQP